MKHWVLGAASASLVSACVIIEPSPPIDPPPSPPPPAGTEITVDVSPKDAPAGGRSRLAFVAIREGDRGAWRPMQEQEGRFSARIRESRYAIALACRPFEFQPGVATTMVSLHHATIEDTTTIEDALCYEAPQVEHSVAGTMTGLTTNERGAVLLSSFLRADAGAGGAFAIVGPPGRYAAAASITDLAAPLAPPRVLRLPDVVLPSAGSLAIDARAAVPPAGYALVLSPTAVTATVASSLNVAGHPMLRLRGSTTQYFTLPPAHLRAGDLVRVAASVRDDDTHQRDAAVYLDSPGAVSLTFPSALGVPAPIISPAARRTARFELPGETSRLPHVDTFINLRTESGAADVMWGVTIHRKWLDGHAASYDVPDLSTIPGYTTAMDLLPATDVTWSVMREERSTRGLVPGALHLSSSVEGVITP